MKQKQIKAMKKQIVEESALNVGYYESVIPEIIEKIDPDTFFKLMGMDSGEWLLKAAKSNDRAQFQNILVSEAVKHMSYSEFKTIANFFFNYKETNQEIIATPLESTPNLFYQLQNESDAVFGAKNERSTEGLKEEESNIDPDLSRATFSIQQDFLSRMKQDPTFSDNEYPELSSMIKQSGMSIVNYSTLSSSQKKYVEQELYLENIKSDPLVVRWDVDNEHSIYSSLSMALIEWYTDQDFSSGFVEEIPEGGTIYDLDAEHYNIKGIESLLKFDYFAGESTSLDTLKELGVYLPAAELIGTLTLQDRAYDEETRNPYDWNENTISEALKGYDYSIMTGIEFFNHLEQNSIEIEGNILRENDFNDNQIVVFDFQNPTTPFYFGESAIEAIDELVSLLPFQDEMQDWDRMWDYDQWISTVEQYLGEPHTITTDYHFEVTQSLILEDLRKAQSDFKQAMIEKSPSELFDQASKILYVTDSLLEVEEFIEEFTEEDYEERSYSYDKQLSALFDRYSSNPPENGSQSFIAAAEDAWVDSPTNYETGTDDKSDFMERYVANYFELSPYLKAQEPKVTESAKVSPAISKSLTL